MHTIALISQKGGAGKTTLALHLAVAAERAGKQAVVIDLDPQASAMSWRDLRTDETPVVVSVQAARLNQALDAAREHGAEVAIIDTAPHSESTALAAARAADLILIPCRPAVLDLRAISTSIDITKLAGRKGYVVLNAVPPRGTIADNVAEAIARYSISVADIRIGQRAAYVNSLTTGRTAVEYEPLGKAAEEMYRLYTWVRGQGVQA